jgi:hypothetical protein
MLISRSLLEISMADPKNPNYQQLIECGRKVMEAEKPAGSTVSAYEDNGSVIKEYKSADSPTKVFFDAGNEAKSVRVTTSQGSEYAESQSATMSSQFKTVQRPEVSVEVRHKRPDPTPGLVAGMVFDSKDVRLQSDLPLGAVKTDGLVGTVANHFATDQQKEANKIGKEIKACMVKPMTFKP